MNIQYSVFCILLLAACAPSTPAETAPPPVPDTVIVVDTVRLEVESAANPELEQRIARLQLELLDRDVRLEGLREQVDAAHQEVVRTMAKLQGQASRAEAASGIAEAEIALQDLQAAAGGQETEDITQAQEFLDESNVEFGEENYAGALYLATQARTIAEGAGLQLRAAGQTRRPGEVPFARPVPLETLRRSNVREGPGLDFQILFTLDPGMALVGRTHTDQWIRITDERGRTGWIFHTLVGTRN